MKVSSLLLVAFPEPSASVKPVFNMKRGVMWYRTEVTSPSIPDSNLGPYALGEFLFTLQKYLSSVPFYKCGRWFWFLPNFVKHYQTSKAPEQDKFLSNENLVETKFVFIFGRAKQIFSAYCVWALCLSAVGAEMVNSETHTITKYFLVFGRSLVENFRLIRSMTIIHRPSKPTQKKYCLQITASILCKHGVVYKFSGKTEGRVGMF